MHVSHQFFRFCIVGTIGFVVDAGSLYLIMAATGAGPFLARFFSFVLAATATWILNRRYTFRASRREPILLEWLRYLGYASIGGAINYGVYALCLLGFELARAHPVIGVAAGSIAGLAFNFLATRHLVFRVAGGKDG